MCDFGGPPYRFTGVKLFLYNRFLKIENAAGSRDAGEGDLLK